MAQPFFGLLFVLSFTTMAFYAGPFFGDGIASVRDLVTSAVVCILGGLTAVISLAVLAVLSALDEVKSSLKGR